MVELMIVQHDQTIPTSGWGLKGVPSFVAADHLKLARWLLFVCV